MSKRFIGIGVVVAAGLVASVAVGGYMMREQARPQTPPVSAVSAVSPEVPAEVFPVSEPAPAANPAVAPTTPAVVPPARAPRVVPASPSTQKPPTPATAEPAEVVPPPVQPTVPPTVVAPPAIEPAPSPAQRYVPDSVTMPAPAPQAEPEPQFEELTVERHAVIGIRLDYAVSTRSAKVEDRVSATVSRNVTVDDRVAIPQGARLEGTVTAVDRGGKFRDRPRLGLQFDTMILTDGTRMSIRTDAIVREGDSPSADAAAKVGAGSAVGAILGGLLGGKKGAVIGGAAGAAGGTAAVMNGDGNETALKAGAPLTVRLTDDLTVIVRKQ